MPLDLIKRSETTVSITASQHDANFTAIENAVNALEAAVAGGGGGTVGTAQIADDAVTYAKMQNVSATDRLLGRATAGAGNIEEIACTAAGRGLIDDADTAAMRTTLAVPYKGDASHDVAAFWRGTQAEYDAIGTKNATTLYVIV